MGQNIGIDVPHWVLLCSASIPIHFLYSRHYAFHFQTIQLMGVAIFLYHLIGQPHRHCPFSFIKHSVGAYSLQMTYLLDYLALNAKMCYLSS